MDVSFVVYKDMRSRSGIHMRLGRGTIYGAPSKKIINTVSSTEVEMEEVLDALSKISWCK